MSDPEAAPDLEVVTAYEDALGALLEARASVIVALSEAVTQPAHYLLCQAIAEITSTIGRVAAAQKADAS